MANVEMAIQLLETFRDRDMWKEGFMTYDDNRATRIHICENAIGAIKEQQEEIEQLKKKPHWIPTMEKLPNAFETVLFADNVEISMGWYDNRNNKFYVVDSILEENARENTVDDAPLYWMPLPKLQKDCEDDV